MFKYRFRLIKINKVFAQALDTKMINQIIKILKKIIIYYTKKSI